MTKRSTAMGAALALALGLGSGGAARADEMPSGEDVFRSSGCPTCHSVAAAGIEAKVKAGPMAGPDLPGAIGDAEPAWLQDFLHQKVKTEAGKKHPKAFKGSDAELSALIGWLESLSGDGS